MSPAELAHHAMLYAKTKAPDLRSLRVWFGGDNWAEWVDTKTPGFHLEAASLGYSVPHVREAVDQALQARKKRS